MISERDFVLNYVLETHGKELPVSIEFAKQAYKLICENTSEELHKNSFVGMNSKGENMLLTIDHIGTCGRGVSGRENDFKEYISFLHLKTKEYIHFEGIEMKRFIEWYDKQKK